MTFADKYSKHAYADLIREAETQGIGLGVMAERERIIELLEADATTGSGSEYCTLPLDKEHCHWCFEVVRLIALIKGDGLD